MGEPSIKYYNDKSAAVWCAMVACGGVIGVGSSLAAHSFLVTSGLLLGMAAVGYMGYWALSKNRYFISASAAGFKDAFRAEEVQFEEIESATRNTGRNGSRWLKFMCRTRVVTIPLDPIDDAWFSDVKAELQRRGIPVSSTVLGVLVKEG